MQGNGRSSGQHTTGAMTVYFYNILNQSMVTDSSPLTPLMMRVPILVTKPLTLSDRNEDRASVDPGS